MDPTFHFDIVADTSINAPLEPPFDFLELARVRSGRIIPSLTTHDTKIVKRCSLSVHEIVRLANIPLRRLSTAEISHVPDIGVG